MPTCQHFPMFPRTCVRRPRQIQARRTDWGIEEEALSGGKMAHGDLIDDVWCATLSLEFQNEFQSMPPGTSLWIISMIDGSGYLFLWWLVLCLASEVDW